MAIKTFIFVFLSLFLVSSVLAATTGSSDVTFITGAGAYLCEKTNSEAHWLNVSNNERILIFNSTHNVTGRCYNATFSTDFCCPKDYKCEDGNCKPSGLEYLGDFCNSLTNNLSCNSAPASFAITTINSFGGGFIGACGSGSSYVGFYNGSALCSNVTSCSCVWNQSARSCMTNLAKETICGNGYILSSSNCSWSEDPDATQNLCDAQGKIVISYSAIGSSAGDITCAPQQVEYPCSVSVQLPFFDKFSFIFSVLAIAGIYALMRRESK